MWSSGQSNCRSSGLALVPFLYDLALVQEVGGRYKEAAATLQKAASLCTRIPVGKTTFPDRAEILLQLGVVLAKMNNQDRAETILNEVVALEQKATGPASTYTMTATHELANLYRKTGKAERAEQLDDYIRSQEQAARKLLRD